MSLQLINIEEIDRKWDDTIPAHDTIVYYRNLRIKQMMLGIERLHQCGMWF